MAQRYTLKIYLSFFYFFQLQHTPEGQFTLSRNDEARSCKHCCCGKAISITYSGCVFVILVIEHAKRTHPITLSSVACPFLKHFHITSQKAISKKENGHKMCVLIFSTTCLRNISLLKKK